jgi:hypothetical protein
MATQYTIYLSSTLNDLAEERKAVMDALAGHCTIKQSYDAAETNLVDSCREDVEKCHLYIGILGLRYGYVPSTDWNTEKKQSITEIEYECAVNKNVPRLVFVKAASGIPTTMTDLYAKENSSGERIEEFRKRISLGKDIRAAEFPTAEALKSLVLRAFMDFKERREGVSALLHARQYHARTLRSDIVIGCVPGTDDACLAAIRRLGDTRFDVVELSPNDKLYLATFDKALRTARVGCLLVTRASLGRLVDAGEKVAAALKMMDERTVEQRQKSAFLVLDGVTPDELPKSWLISKTIKLPGGSVAGNTKESLEALFLEVRADTTAIACNTVVGLPYVVLALNQSEAVRMITQPAEAFEGYPDALQRDLRKAQFTALQDVLAKADAGWPGNCYGPRRDDWRPLGPRNETAQRLLESVVDRINQSKPGSRERRMLRDAQLQLQRYTFDEFLDDQFGSRDNLVAVRDSGCLVLVDEIALLHPALRKEAERLLRGPRAAIVSISPFDPERQPISKMLDDMSPLKVGTLVDRFREAQDPRCELALNSIERVERWLRLVLPELVASTEDLESQPDLVATADDKLFS